MNDALTLHPAQHPAYPVTLYGKPDRQCFGCKKTKDLLNEAGIQYRFVDLTDPANEADFDALQALGVKQVPYVVTPTMDWSGLLPDTVAEAIDEYREAVGSAA